VAVGQQDGAPEGNRPVTSGRAVRLSVEGPPPPAPQRVGAL